MSFLGMGGLISIAFLLDSSQMYVPSVADSIFGVSCAFLFWYMKSVHSVVSVNCMVNGSQSSANMSRVFGVV
jgi:hypothetical protein